MSSKINCSMCLTFVKPFFSNDLSPTVRDHVLAHLLACPNCAKKFVSYAKEIGLKQWKVVDAAMDFITKKDKYHNARNLIHTQEELSHLGLDKEMEIRSKVWTRAANMMDMEKLMQMKSFRDLMQEDVTYRQDEMLDYYEFGKFLALKLAQKVDHLEECYLKKTRRND